MTKQDNFVHLHNHSEYSALDGLPSPEVMVQRAVELGQPGIGISDHGSLSGVVEFARKAKEYHIKPIIGYEGYTTRFGNSLHDKDSSNRENYHTLLLAESEAGYHNLIKLASIASTVGFYGKPRFDFDTLEQHRDGIIATTGCMASPILRAIAQGYNPSYIETLFEWYIDVFGTDNFFIELQDHVGIPDLVKYNKVLLDYAKKYNLRVLATNDAHYARPEDAVPHDLLLCVQTRQSVFNPNRMKFTDQEYYIKTREEMEKGLSKYGLGPDCLDLSLEIMERCGSIDVESKQKHHMPSITIASADYDTQLLNDVRAGMNSIFGSGWEKRIPGYKERLKHELGIIKDTGFAVYFLIIKDICDYARTKGILWNVRGSGAGSLVSYSTGMSFIDPVKHSLIFERFLNPERVSIPDFDMDFPDNAREEIIKYLIEKYGEDRVAQIVTFGRMKARLCVRDVTRSLGWGQTDIDSLANKINNTPGKPITIENSLEPTSEYFSIHLKEEYDKNPAAKQALDISKRLEKTVRHSGVHAAAVIISDKPITEYAPIGRAPQIATTKYVAQYDYPTLESLGMLKVDILGLATLSIIREASTLIKQRHGVDIDYFKIPFEDGDDVKLAFELLRSGEVKGVFQVESFGLRSVLMELQPTNFQQIMDVISLYRPGPIDYIPNYIKRSYGKEKLEYPHDDLKDILESTQAIMIYQEQIIRILQKMGGYTLGQADVVRKVISKKEVAKMDKEKKHFITAATEQGYTEDEAIRVFDDIEKFALYGFNLAHAASYARMTMITAWLKANYPVEYITACLITEWDKPEKITGYVLEARRMGIPVLAPDVNKSELGFSIDNNPNIGIEVSSRFDYNIPKGTIIRFGFQSIKQVGEKMASALVRSSGNVNVLNDILKIDMSDINTRSLRRLIGAGVFDNLAPRGQLIGNEESIIGRSNKAQRVYLAGQHSFATPKIELQQASTDIDLYKEEKESLGVWITKHPIEDYYNKYFGHYTHTLYDVMNDDSVEETTMILVVDAVKDITTKNGKPMSFITFSDMYGTIESSMFSSVYKNYRSMLIEDKIVIVRGKISHYKEEPTLMVNGVYDQISPKRAPDNRDEEAYYKEVKVYTDDDIDTVSKWVTDNRIFVEGSRLVVKVFTSKGKPAGNIRKIDSVICSTDLKSANYNFSLE